MNNPLFLFVGKSASGKTTIANMLEVDGYKQVQSYTTRAPRYEGEPGHIFITEEEYQQLDNIVASTLYNGYHYCTTMEQIQNSDIYVVDVPGIETLLTHYDELNRPIYVFYFEASVRNRILRMLDRHDSDTAIVSRLLNDEKDDWEMELRKIEARNIDKLSLICTGTNIEIQEVYGLIKKYIEIIGDAYYEEV